MLTPIDDGHHRLDSFDWISHVSELKMSPEIDEMIKPLERVNSGTAKKDSLLSNEFLDAYFTISVDPFKPLIRIQMGGFFSEGGVGAFRLELQNTMVTLKCKPNEHVTLCDVSLMKIQPQEIVGLFSKVVGHHQFRSKRLAFVTGSSLARLQTRRLTSRDGVEFFECVVDAEAWLLAEPRPQ